MNNIKQWGQIIVVIAICITLAAGGWILQRKIHYSLSYQTLVQTEICNMVKPEYLKDASKCK